MKLKLDLHEIYNCGDPTERTLRSMIEAVAGKAPLVEIMPGNGSGQRKKRAPWSLDSLLPSNGGIWQPAT